MDRPFRSLIALTMVAALVAVTPVWSAPESRSRLEGLVLGIDGRPVDGHAVHLIDHTGRAVARAGTDHSGFYSFQDLPGGRYSLGIENPQGLMAPVDAPPVKLGEQQLARRDLKLMSADEETQGQTVHGNYGLGNWWAGLTPAAKAWTIVAIVVVVGVTVALVTDDDKPASEFQPATLDD